MHDRLGASFFVSFMSLHVLLTAVQVWARTHRRGVVWGIGLGMGGLAATAFGLAPLAPDASRLPQQVVTQTLPLGVDLNEQLEALSALPLELYRSDTTRKQDTADALLARLGVNDAQAAAFMRQDRVARKLFEGRAQKMVRAKADASGRLIELVARYPVDQRQLADTHFTRLSLTRIDDAWVSTVETVELQSRVQLGSGIIRTSIDSST